MLNKKRVNTGDIIIGRPLSHDVYDAEGVLLLQRGQILESQKQIDTLLARGLYFIFNVLPARIQSTKAEKLHDATPFGLIDDIYFQLSTLCKSQNTKVNFPSRVIDLCKRLQQACQKDADAALGAIFLSKERKYSIMHQIHCALVLEIFLKHLGRSSAERLPLLAAGLTMNIAMIGLQDVLFNQKGVLTEGQRVEVKNHPHRGAELLRSYGVADEAWLTTVLQHHEFIDGSGYSQGLRGDDICQTARMLMLADIYCAKLFPRAYRVPLHPDRAAREMFTGSRGHCFDMDLSKLFIKELGLFHPGSFVRLSNGEIAVVIRRGEKIHHPIVCSVVKADGSPYLAPRQRDCSKDEFAITDSVAPKDITININKRQLWGYD